MLNTVQRVRKHAREFFRAFRTHQYEQSANGIVFPRQGLEIAGLYEYGLRGGPLKQQKNLIVAEGIGLILNVALGATTKPGGFFLAPYGGAINPAANWTAANFTATATENVSTTEGFSQTTRPAWTPASASGGTITNNASKAGFTIVATSSVTFQGAGLLTSNVRGGTSGALVNAVRFTNPEVLNNGATWDLGWSCTLTDVD